MFYLVIFQVIVLTAITGFVYLWRLKTSSRTPIDDVGVMWLIIFFIYATFPALLWLAQGGEYIPINYRLFNLGTQPEDMVYLLNLCITCMFSFCFFYYILRRNQPINSNIYKVYIGTSIMLSAAVIIFFNFMISIFFGSFSIIPTAENYLEGYQIAQTLPLGLRQITKILNGFDFVAWVIVLTGLFQRWPKAKLGIYGVFFYLSFPKYRGR